MKYFSSALALCLTALAAYAQNEVTLYKGEKIKKEGELYGIMKGKEWEVPPKYNKLEAYEWNYLFAHRDNKIDVYRNWGNDKKLLSENLSAKDVNTYKAFANKKNEAIFNGSKWGFKNYINKIIEPQYDSIFPLCNDCDEVCFKLDGKLGVVNTHNETIIPPNDYISFRWELLKLEVIGQKIIIIASKPDGTRKFFSPFKGELPDNFEAAYVTATGENGTIVQWNKFWNGLKIFKNKEGKLGLVTNEGKIFLPPSAEWIRFKHLVFKNDADGIAYHENSTNWRLTNSHKDTLALMPLFDNKFITESTSVEFQPYGLDDTFIQYGVDWTYDYHKISRQDFECNWCENGVRYYTETNVETKVIREEETVTQKNKVVWADLNEYGRFPTTTTTYTIPAEVEKKVTTSKHSVVCTNCKGYVHYSKTFGWDAGKQAFVGFYEYGKK